MARTVGISMLPRAEGSSDPQLLEAAPTAPALAPVGSGDSFTEGAGWSGPSVTAAGAGSELGEAVPRTSARAFAPGPTGPSVDPAASPKPRTRAVGRGAGGMEPIPATEAVAGAGDFKESLFAPRVTPEQAAASRVVGDDPAGSRVVSCGAGGDLLATSITAAGTRLPSKAVVLWKKPVGVVA